MKYLKKINENFNKIKTIEEKTPLNDGYIRLYHNTSKDALNSILENGLDPSKNTQFSEGEVTWLDTQPCNGYGGHTIFVDMPIDKMKPYKVNSTQYIYPFLIEPEKIKVCEVPIIHPSNGGPFRTSDIIRWINNSGIDVINKLREKKYYKFDQENWDKYIEPLIKSQ